MKSIASVLLAILLFIIIGAVALWIIGVTQIDYPLEEDPGAPFYWDNPSPATPTLNIGMGGLPFPTLPPAVEQNTSSKNEPDPYPGPVATTPAVDPYPGPITTPTLALPPLPTATLDEQAQYYQCWNYSIGCTIPACEYLKGKGYGELSACCDPFGILCAVPTNAPTEYANPN